MNYNIFWIVKFAKIFENIVAEQNFFKKKVYLTFYIILQEFCWFRPTFSFQKTLRSILCIYSGLAKKP